MDYKTSVIPSVNTKIGAIAGQNLSTLAAKLGSPSKQPMNLLCLSFAKESGLSINVTFLVQGG